MITDGRRTREQIARVVREEVREALQTLLPAIMASNPTAPQAAPQGEDGRAQPLQVQPARTRRLKLGRSLGARSLNAPRPGAGPSPAPSANGGGAQPPASQQSGAGGAAQGQAGAASPLTGPQLLQEMEANLLRLRQVIRETQALADRMETFLEGDARGRFAGPGRPDRRGGRRNPF